MATRIKLTDYKQEIARLQLGEQARYNHKNCPAGEDTKRRLYLKRLDDAEYRVVAHCFNCGGKGYTDTGRFYNYGLYSSHKSGKDTPAMVSGPMAGEDKFPAMWYYWYNIPMAKLILQRTSAIYDPITESIYTPIFLPKSTTFLGYNIRRCRPSGLPRYKLEYNSTLFPGYQVYTPAEDNNKMFMVFCEDQMSAAAISLAGGYGVCLFGAKNNVEKIHALVADAEYNVLTYIIWYDNDNPAVIEAAENCYQYIAMTKRGDQRCGIITDSKEPKYFTSEAIMEKISNLWK